MKKYILTFFCSIFIFSLTAAPDNSGKTDIPAPGQHRPHRPPRRFSRGHGIWLAFSELSQAERKEMLKLQRENPEMFRTEMLRRSEEFIQAEKKRKDSLDKLVKEYRISGDKEKAEILEKIKSSVKENFQRRLRRSRMQLEELRERADKLEKELDRREKAGEKIIDAVVKNIIEGKQPARHPYAGKAPHPNWRNAPRPAPLKAE